MMGRLQRRALAAVTVAALLVSGGDLWSQQRQPGTSSSAVETDQPIPRVDGHPSEGEIAAPSQTSRPNDQRRPGQIATFGPWEDPESGIHCVNAALEFLAASAGGEQPRNFPPVQFEERLAGSETSFVELQKAVQDAGLYASIVTGLNAASLRQARTPLLLHVAADGQLPNYNYCILFVGMNDGKARIIDGQRAIEDVSLASLLNRWDGIAMAISSQPVDLSSLRWAGVIPFTVMLVVTCTCLMFAESLVSWCRKPTGDRARRLFKSQRLLQPFAVLFVAIIVAIGAECVGTAGLLQNPDDVSHTFLEYDKRKWPHRSLVQLKELMRSEDVLIVDARFRGSYDRGRINGAINIPVNMPFAERQRIVAKVPRSQQIVVYSDSCHSPFHDKIAAWLTRVGFTDISIYLSGWEEWKDNAQEYN